MGTVPVFQEYMQTILDVLRRAARALTIEELDRLVVEAMKLPPDVVAIPHDPERPDRSEVGYRMAWARTYLKKAGCSRARSAGIGLSPKLAATHASSIPMRCRQASPSRTARRPKRTTS